MHTFLLLSIIYSIFENKKNIPNTNIKQIKYFYKISLHISFQHTANKKEKYSLLQSPTHTKKKKYISGLEPLFPLKFKNKNKKNETKHKHKNNLKKKRNFIEFPKKRMKIMF